MRKIVIVSISLVALLTVFMALRCKENIQLGKNILSKEVKMHAREMQVNWINWTELEELQKTEPKKVFIFVHTQWCGHCKKMKREVFTDPQVIDLLNKDFYSIKFDAESKSAIQFNNVNYLYDYNYAKRRNGTHKLAIELLNNDLLYPSSVFLSAQNKKLKVFRGASSIEHFIGLLAEMEKI